MPKTIAQLVSELDDSEEEVLSAYAFVQFRSTVNNDVWLRVILSCGCGEDRESIETYIAKVWPETKLPTTEEMRASVLAYWTKRPPTKELDLVGQAKLYLECIKEAQLGIQTERDIYRNPNLEKTVAQYEEAINRYLWWIKVNGFEITAGTHA